METTLVIAFVAGLVSFLSPCVLPLVPAYMSFLAGVGIDETGKNRWQMFITSLFFVLGFSVIFSLLGIILNTILSDFVYLTQVWLGRIGGTFIILFGLYLLGLIKIPYLDRGHKVVVKRKFNSKYVSSFVFGSAFAVGWTPCVGAVLGATLVLAASQPGIAFPLLLSYSIGLGLPFILVGLFASASQKLILKYAKHLRYVSKVFGVVLIILGVLVFTNSLNLIANFGPLNSLLLR